MLKVISFFIINGIIIIIIVIIIIIITVINIFRSLNPNYHSFSYKFSC